MNTPRDHPALETGPGTTAPGWRFTHDAMACTFGVRIVGDDEHYAAQAARAAFLELDRLDALLNRFIPHSDIARIHQLHAGESVPVALDTIACLQLAAAVYRDTHGAFDIAFRGRRDAATVEMPAGLTTPLVFDPVHHAVGVQIEGVVLDLGGIGKGYALDRMAAALRDWRIDAALLDSGQSSVCSLGRPGPDADWSVGLRRPDREDQTLATLELSGRALSGSAQRLHGGHIIDPHTRQAAQQHAAAWALAPTAAASDALSTAFMVMAPTEVEAYCADHTDVSALLRRSTADGEELSCYGAHPPLLRYPA